ncbi:MAG: nucleoside-diphosphate sugar epimerase/dehydratase [Legionellaceae bacterium]|nr:nucleoside-diphosphate sugar epimerase/dehydratase [Legionellaceae bacterium]
MLFWKKGYLKLPTLAYDIIAIPIAWYFAYWLRSNMQFLPHGLLKSQSLYTLALLIVVQVGCYYHFKVYRGLWRFSSIDDVERIVRSVLSTTILVIPILYLSMLDHIPRSILPLYSITLVILLCGGRFCVRHFWDKRLNVSKTNDVQRVFIIGAGQAGESLLRELKRLPNYLPIGMIDDSLNKRGLDIHGVRVLGTISDLPNLAIINHIDLIFIAIPSASSSLMRRIVNYCEQTKIPFRTLPSMQAITSGRVEVNLLRTVSIEDLLGRDQVKIHWDKIAANIENKRVLVTGGGGSIGSELCRQIASFKPSKLLILDSNEFNLYNIEREFQIQFPNILIELTLVNVTDVVGVNHVFESFKPEIVFHAAAYKHVPMLEGQIRVAVQNNVIGTQIVAQASVEVGAAKFILISSDKAVNPTNVMGTTKRVAEIYCQNLDKRVATEFITVRFGNVLGSTGSVVPLFQQQLERGGPLTVTHPDMQRYFMTIPEATQLILQAMVNGQGGEIFVLNMGDPVKISYLAEQMIRLMGKEPGKDIEIKYTGLRPGEKLFEELFHDSELLVETEHEKLFQAKYRETDWNELTDALHLIHQACESQQTEELLFLLKNLVPEFSYKYKLMTDTFSSKMV